MIKKKPGYVLILAVLITALITVSVATLINRVLVFGRLTSALKNREQARLLALSGLQIAIAQLTAATTAQKVAGKEKPAPKEPIKSVPELLILINRWQQFNFTQESDNLDGSCQIYIASEQGKININALYDFTKKQFIKNNTIDGRKICQLIGERLSPLITANKFIEAVEAALKEHTEPLQDITQLLTQKQFAPFKNNIFMQPSTKTIALTDLFTTSTENTLLQQWFLSRSLCTIIDLVCIGTIEIKKIEDSLKKVSLNDTVPVAQQWDNALAPLYGKKIAAIARDFQLMLNQKCELQTFSVVSYGTFGGIVEKIYAIVYKQQGSPDKPGSYCIQKLYWI